MSINIINQRRVKPTLLRDIKTEALLVFVRTTIEQTIKEFEVKEKIPLGEKKDRILIKTELEKLLEKLQASVVNSTYLRVLVSKAEKEAKYLPILKQEKPLIFYYQKITKTIEQSLQQGKSWMPELLVFALLSEWVLEEGKSNKLYPFLNDIDYIKLLSLYDLVRNKESEEKKEVIHSMYKIASLSISNLKKAQFKINTSRVSKKRKK